LKKIFLVKDAPHEYREERRHDKQNAPPRTERERYRRDEEQCSRIHRVPDVCIGAGGYDGLPLLYLNGGRGIAIRLHHQEEQNETQCNDSVCDNGHDGRNRRPTEAMVEAGITTNPTNPAMKSAEIIF